MTLSRLAVLASLAVLVAALTGFVLTGDLWVGMWILAAPIPLQVVHGF